jgi:lysyl-tRNA synthetase class 2
VPIVAGVACYGIGLTDILASVLPELRRSKLHRLAAYLPGMLESTAVAAVMVVGILLVLLAHALRRRKRRAWRAVVLLLATSVMFHAVRYHGFASLVLSLIMLVGLVVYRQDFYALGDPRSRWRAVLVFLALAVFSIGLGLAIVSARPRALIGDPSFGTRLRHVLYGLVGVTGPLRFKPGADRIADLTSSSLFALGLLTIVVTVYLALRPAEPVPRLMASDEERLRELLERHGHRDSLGYFALRRDKSVVFSPTGKAAVAYRVLSGVMLASGDPIGDPEAWPGAIARFLVEADRHAWVPAVMGCSEQGGEIWCREGGFDALELGDEAIVEIKDFTTEGRAMRNVRQMVNRVSRQGYEASAHRLRDMSTEQITLIRRQAANWRGSDTERGWSMALERFGDPSDGDCVVVTAEKDGEVRAFLNFVPWGRDGLSLDLMRRDRTADPGLNEFLIVAALREAKSMGIKRVSLNFAMFRSSLERGERLGAGPVLRAWRGILLFFSRWFQIESLYKFNAKFRPVWEPRFVVFQHTRDLPRIAVAALEAEAFLVLPRFLRRGMARPQALEPVSTADVR